MSEWDNVEFYIKEFELERWFDLDKIVYSDGTIPGKPAPDIFEIAASKIGLKPSECVVIEDALAGIKSAQSAGAGKIIAIASLEPMEFYQNIEGIDKIIKDFYEIDKNLFSKTEKISL
jgi:beta-phosphoglucomutase-like phosphatase (HAD superfamily)